MSDYGYEEYLADLDAMERDDREPRFHVLDSAVAVEHEFLSVAAFYLGGASEPKQELVDRLIGEWGGIKAATGIIRNALTLHGRANAQTESSFGQVKSLMDLRHLLAHGTTESWQANPLRLETPGLADNSARERGLVISTSIGSTSRKRKKRSPLADTRQVRCRDSWLR